MESIYTNGKGDQLINPANYNDEIILFLTEEAKLFDRACLGFDTIVEAGCMAGRYYLHTMKLNKFYLGFDQESRYIDAATDNYPNAKKGTFVCSDIIHLPQILNERAICIDQTIVQFPFNSFGNVSDQSLILKTLLAARINIIIYTYQNNDLALDARKDYYKRSGFNDLKIISNDNGVAFITDTGLNSVAVSRQWIKNIGKETNIPFYPYVFANIGLAYANFKLP